MLRSKNSIRSMQAMNAMKVSKRLASWAAPSAPKSKKGTKAMKAQSLICAARNGPPSDAGRMLEDLLEDPRHLGVDKVHMEQGPTWQPSSPTIPVGQGPAWIRDMGLSEEIGSGTEWTQVNVGGGIKTVVVKKFTKMWTHLDGHMHMHPGVGAPNNWYRKDSNRKRLGMDFARLQTEHAKLKAKLAELEKSSADEECSD